MRSFASVSTVAIANISKRFGASVLPKLGIGILNVFSSDGPRITGTKLPDRGSGPNFGTGCCKRILRGGSGPDSQTYVSYLLAGSNFRTELPGTPSMRPVTPT